jgi:hypothetical protein
VLSLCYFLRHVERKKNLAILEAAFSFTAVNEPPISSGGNSGKTAHHPEDYSINQSLTAAARATERALPASSKSFVRNRYDS